jgi:fido (protein-threonine AMPylation protein)
VEESEGNGGTQRAVFKKLAREAGCALAWQHLDAARNIEASASGLVHMGNRPRAATISRCRPVQ